MIQVEMFLQFLVLKKRKLRIQQKREMIVDGER